MSVVRSAKNVSVFFNAERRDINELDAIADTLAAGPSAAVPAPRTRTNLSSAHGLAAHAQQHPDRALSAPGQ